MSLEPGATLGVAGPGCARVGPWVFHHFTESDFADYEAWAKQLAMEELLVMKTALDPYTYRDAMSALVSDCAAGAYRWSFAGPGPGIVRLLQSAVGVIRAAETSLHHAHPVATTQEVEELFKNHPEDVVLAVREAVSVPPTTSQSRASPTNR